MSELKTLARPYAKAAYEVARTQQCLEDWTDILKTLATVASDSKVQSLLKSPSVSVKQQVQYLKDICVINDRFFASFLDVLGNNNRLLLLPMISEMFHTHFLEEKQIAEVEIETAVPLDPQQTHSVSSTLQAKLEKQVYLRQTHNESLLSGTIIHTGNSIINGSIKGRLNKFAQQITF